MNETVISWTIPNIVTIALMMIVSSAIIGAIAKMVATKRAKNDA